MNISEIKSVSHLRNTVTSTMNDGTATKEKYRYAADARNAHAELKNQLDAHKIAELKAAFDASAIEAVTGLKVVQVSDTYWKIGETGMFSVRIYADGYWVSTKHIPHCNSAMPQATWEGVMEQVSRDLAKPEAVIETVEIPVIAAPTMETVETPAEKKEKELAAALTAVRKMAKEQEMYPIYEIRLYRAGKAGFETRASFASLIEWLEKYPKYFRSYSARSNRFLMSGMLYQVVALETPEAITVTEPVSVETNVKAELAAHLSTFIETEKRALAKAADIHPAALSKVLNGSQLSFTTLESLMSALNLALRPSVFMTVWTARNMETIDTELIIEHYLLRKGDFTPLQRGKLFDFILLPRISDTEITPFDGCRWRVVKLGKRRLAASLDPNGVFSRYVAE